VINLKAIGDFREIRKLGNRGRNSLTYVNVLDKCYQ